MSAEIINFQTAQNKAVRPAPRDFLKFRLVQLIIVVLILTVAGTGYLLIHKRNAQVAHYKAAGLSTYNLTSPTVGTSASFEKPSEFKTSTAPTPKDYSVQVLLTQSSASGSAPDIGRIALAVDAANPATLNASNADFAYKATNPNPQDTSYQALLKPTQDFVNQRLPKAYSLTALGIPRAITTPNISSGAWIMGLSAIGPSKDSPPIVGEAVLVYGKHAIYYFMVENIGSTWQANQAFWQKVFSSLKIDQ